MGHIFKTKVRGPSEASYQPGLDMPAKQIKRSRSQGSEASSTGQRTCSCSKEQRLFTTPVRINAKYGQARPCALALTVKENVPPV